MGFLLFSTGTCSSNSSTTLNGRDVGGGGGLKSYSLLSLCGGIVGHFAGLNNGEFDVLIHPLKSTRNKTKGGHGGLRGSRLIET